MTKMTGDKTIKPKIAKIRSKQYFNHISTKPHCTDAARHVPTASYAYSKLP